MKKLLSIMFIAIVAMVAFCSCSKEDDGETLKTLDDLTLFAGQEISLPQEGSWTSDNEFVTSISSSRIKAIHCGTANIKLQQGREILTCKVEVVPRFSVYEEPILEWGKTPSEIQKKEKGIFQNSYFDKNTGYKNFLFKRNGRIESLAAYSFKNDELVMVSILLDTFDALNVPEMIKERYEFAGVKDGTTLYAHMTPIDGGKGLKVDYSAAIIIGKDNVFISYMKS